MATGKKTGGRAAGTPNKATAARSAASAGGVFPASHARVREGLGASGTVSDAAAQAFPEYRLAPVASLIPYEKNARTHSAAQVTLIAALITEYGFTNPVLVDGKRGVIAGHGRVLAAKKLGMTVVPTIELSHLSDVQRRAYILADNQSALKAGWDDDLLRLELGELRDLGFNLDLTGFDAIDLDAVFGVGTGGRTDPDDVPPLQAVAVSRPGDVWILGTHRLACGDSTDAGVVAAVLAGAKPHLMVTDPPYGVNYDPTWSDGGKGGTRVATSRAHGKVSNDDRADWREAWALFPGHVAYVWHTHMDAVQASLVACKYAIRAQIVWVKSRPVVSRGDYHWQHESLAYAVAEDASDDHWRFAEDHEVAEYAVRVGSTGHWQGSRKQSTVWNIDHTVSETGHSTQKPVECMRRPMENNSAPRDLVYEPFSGSGTTIIAGEMTGRVVLAIELDPLYVDVAVRRWQDFTGLVAQLASTGEEFDAVALRRAAGIQLAGVVEAAA